MYVCVYVSDHVCFLVMLAGKQALKLFKDAVREAVEFIISSQPEGEFSEEDIDTLLDPNSSLLDTTAESSCANLSASVLLNEFGTPGDILTRGSPRNRKRKKLRLLAESTSADGGSVKKYCQETGNGVKRDTTMLSSINPIDPLLETSELGNTFSFSRKEDSFVVVAGVSSSSPSLPHSTASDDSVALMPQSSLPSSLLCTPTSVTETHTLAIATSALANTQSLVHSTPHSLGDRFVSSTPISASSLSKTTPSPCSIPTRSSSPSLASTGFAVVTPSFSDSEDELPAVNLSAKEICGEWYRSE